MFQRWTMSQCRSWPTLLWLPTVVILRPAAVWRSERWRGASTPCSCSSSSSCTKQMTYTTASWLGSGLVCHNALIFSEYLCHFWHFSVRSARKGDLEREALAAAVPSFLYTCQPYFNYLESTAWSTRAQHTPLPFNIYTRVNSVALPILLKYIHSFLYCNIYKFWLFWWWMMKW